MRNVYCPYCGRQAEYVDSKVIYGRSYGMAYLCRNCDAYVGVHRGTDEPLGRLADASLRKWKKAAHAAFDPLWLAQQLGLPVSETHIGMFDVEECISTILICSKETKGDY